MKVLFQSRKTLYSVPGGDTTQIMKTKEFLEKLGVIVDVSLELTPDVSEYDVVHVFNLMRPQELYLQVKNAKNIERKLLFLLFTDRMKNMRRWLVEVYCK